jgi:hypothetical protein
MNRFGFVHPTAQIDELIDTGVLRRLLALTELKVSNSMIDAWWRSLTHQWLFLHSLSINRPFAARNGREVASESPECP